MIDRTASRQTGALALQQTGSGFAVTPARPAAQERPWTSRYGGGTSGDRAGTAPAATPRPGGRDATPRLEDIED